MGRKNKNITIQLNRRIDELLRIGEKKVKVNGRVDGIFNTIIQTLLFTGLRIGECLCLEWDDIDFEHSTVSVSETLAYAYYEKYASTTKNTQSVRTLKLGEYSMSLLKRHKEKQDELKAIVGKAWKYPTFVFTTEIGEYINYGSINDKLKALLEENKLPYTHFAIPTPAL